MKTRIKGLGQIDFTASGNKSAGDLIDFSKFVGISINDVANGEDGIAELFGVFTLPKDTALVIDQYDVLYWDSVNSWCDKTQTSQTTVGIAYAAATETATTVQVLLNIGNYTAIASIVAALEALAGANRLSSDALKDGTTSHVFTAANDIELAGLVAKVGASNAAKFFAKKYTATADDATNNYMQVDTGFAEAPDGYIVQVFRAGVNVTTDAIVSVQSTDNIRVADGAATYVVTENDVLMLTAWVEE